ncbi:MAG: fasciclin domain-containing protein [Candidatus Kapaibacteriales bacterium]
MKKLNIYLLALLAGFFMVSCDDDDDTTPIVDDGDNIVEVLNNDPELSTLRAALAQAGLLQTVIGLNDVTLFAPNNDAFDAYLSENGFDGLTDVPVDALKQVLMYHILGMEVMAADLTTGYVNTIAMKDGMTDGEALDIFVEVDGSDVTLNLNNAMPVMTDVEASNGVIHTVDKVLVPQDIASFVASNSQFSSLLAALTRSDLVSVTDFLAVLDDGNDYTVFAPTNGAFEKLLESNSEWTTLADVPVNVLDMVLKYHVVAGNNASSGLMEGNVPTLQGGEIEVMLPAAGGVTLKSSTQEVPVAIADVQATNGVIHAIETVLLPEMN